MPAIPTLDVADTMHGPTGDSGEHNEPNAAELGSLPGEIDSAPSSMRKLKFSWKSPQLLASTKRFSVGILHVKPNASSSALATPTSPGFDLSENSNRQNSQSNETTSSSVSIEESRVASLSRSFYSLKRTTKSILFLDSTPSISGPALPSSSSESPPDLVEGLADRIEAEDTDLRCRRSQSYNHGVVINESPERAAGTISRAASPDTASVEAERTGSPININRQRSRTLNSLDNPLSDLTGGNAGILASITNFVKLNRSSQRKSSVTSTVTSTMRTKDALSLMEGETPSSYLDTLLESYPLTQIISILSLSDNSFAKEAMQIFFERFFDFSEMPLDMALRYFLMVNDLPRETQQIDRVVYQFAKCYAKSAQFSEDSLYILTFSLIMLNTDKFNPNNKNKMTRFDFVRNVDDALKSNGNFIDRDLIGYLYDNITHAAFTKITPEQSAICLRALETKEPLPYPAASFLNSDQYQQQHPAVVQVTVTSPSNTTLTEKTISRSSSMQQLSIVSQQQLRRRRSSTSFLWTSPLPLDPYQYIVDRNVPSLRVTVPELTFANPFLNTRIQEKPEPTAMWTEARIQLELDSYASDEFTVAELTKIVNSMTHAKVDLLLKVPKSKGSFLTLNKFAHTIPLNEPKNIGSEYYVARVLKVGMLNRQESKTLTNTRTWKKYFCVLTPLGLFMFKSVSLFKMVYAGTLGHNKAVVIEESDTTGLLEQFQPTFSINRGSFASRKVKNLELDQIVNSSPLFGGGDRTPNLQNYTFFIYGANTNAVFMVSNVYEMRSWIMNINVVNAMNGLKLPHENIDVSLFGVDPIGNSADSTDSGDTIDTQSQVVKDKYYEIAPEGEETVDERIAAICDALECDPETFATLPGTHSQLWQQIEHMRTLQTLTPLQTKTRDSLLSAAKMVSIKVEWMWFEKCRSRMILEYLVKLKKLQKPRELASGLQLHQASIVSIASNNSTTSHASTANSNISESHAADEFYSCFELSL